MVHFTSSLIPKTPHSNSSTQTLPDRLCFEAEISLNELIGLGRITEGISLSQLTALGIVTDWQSDKLKHTQDILIDGPLAGYHIECNKIKKPLNNLKIEAGILDFNKKGEVIQVRVMRDTFTCNGKGGSGKMPDTDRSVTYIRNNMGYFKINGFLGTTQDKNICVKLITEDTFNEAVRKYTDPTPAPSQWWQTYP
jgi:hypothetical protein